MRRSPSALLSVSSLSTLILCILISSTFSFAAAPDRITSPIVARQTVALPAGVHYKAQPQYDQGRVDASFRLSYVTLLTVPSASQQKAINRLLAQQQDPRSPLYHKWLTPEQYADRFGLSVNDVKKITAWLQSQGFSVGKVARSRNLIAFSGTVAQVESVFQTEIHHYKVDGEVHFANAVVASIPAALSGVVTGLSGLNNFRPKSHAIHSEPHYTLPVGGNDFLFLAPGDIATIYDINPLYAAGIDGSGQTLAVIGQTDVYLADLNDFRSGFGIPQISGCTTNSKNIITACNASNFQYVLVNADPGTPSAGDLVEADIDLEWSGAVAHKAQIIYVNAPDPNGNGVWAAWHQAVTDNLSPVITLSYGLCELGEASNGDVSVDEGLLQQANLQGITFLNSSGDSGAAECDFQTNLPSGGYAVSYPASSPSVTGVGGTLIPYTEFSGTYWDTSNGTDGGSALSYIPEVAWNDEQEWGELCVANPADSFCTRHSITSWATAQSFIGVLAGGGGKSNCVTESLGVCTGGFPQPTWQQGLIVPPGAPPAVRFSPDVSLLASVYWPGFIVCTPASEVGGIGTTSTCDPGGATGILNNLNNFGFTFGGTSISSPIFAGIVTLLNQYLAGSGTPGLGNINPKLYSLAATPANGAFHPLTTGSNGAFCTPGDPANQPPALQCPPAGFLGFDASSFDPTTGYNLVNGLGSVDANNLAIAWDTSRTSTTTSLSPSTNNTFEGVSVVLTAHVAPSAATGTVSFFNGTSTIGTAALSGGVATLTTASLPVGTNSITASYDGDGTQGISTSPVALVIVVAAFTLSGPDASVTQGQSGTSTITVVPAAGFSSAIAFTCSDPASESTCSLSPASITPPVQTTTLTVTTTAAAAQLRLPLDRGNQIFYAMLLPGLFGIVLTLGSRKRAARGVRLLGFIVVLGLSTLWLAACGGGGGGGVKDPGTPKGTYTITVNATSGTVHHSTTLKLTVN